MYYGADEVEKALKCAFCANKLDGEIRLIPECGCFICSMCHVEVIEDAAETGSYKCEACLEMHSMPNGVLADCKQLLPLLQSQPFEKPISENAKKLKTLIKEVVDEMEKLDALDIREVVNEHCDQLEQEVKETVASAIERLSRIEEDLLNEINDYRNQCFSKADGRKTKQELEALSSQVEEFEVKWSCYFTRPDLYVCEADIDASLDRVEYFRTEMFRLEKRLMNDALGGRLIVFKPNLAFFERSDILGEFKNLERRVTCIQEMPSMTMTGHSSRIWALLHISDRRLASGSNEKTIRVWDLKEGKELFKLEGHTGTVFCLATLNSGLLASGSQDFTIKIWDLEQRKEIRTLQGHTNSVLSLCVLKYGNLASCSSDGNIKIWNPHLSENNLLQTIGGHGNVGWIIPIGLMKNDHLVSCSRTAVNDEEAFLRVWHARNSRLVREVPTGLKAACSLLVLKDDRVAIGYHNGSIRIVDTTNDANSVTKDRAHDSFVFTLAQFSNGNLISSGRDNSKRTIKIWTLPDFGLLQTIETIHSQNVAPISISSDETSIASAGEDFSTKMWTLTN